MSNVKGLSLDPLKVIGLILVLGGGFTLARGKFGFTEEKHTARVGEVAFTVEERRTVDLPKWLGIGALAVGVILTVLPTRRRVL
jgi:uncharacterized membrane protein YdcZ (DUF606 family)